MVSAVLTFRSAIGRSSVASSVRLIGQKIRLPFPATPIAVAARPDVLAASPARSATGRAAPVTC